MKKLLILLTIVQGYTSCKSIAWIGYKKPTNADFINLNIDNNCMKIGTQNLDNKQKQAILEAAKEVCKIFSKDEFRQKVEKQNWLLSCDLTENGKPDEMTGLEVYNMLQGKINDYSVNPRKPWRAIAQTQRNENNVVYNRVAIEPKRIRYWYSSVDSIKSKLINTIAHETTHIISYSFQDRGHGSTQCSNNRLVSYGIGDLVEKIWLEKNH